MPNSVLWICLVAIWLFVLVPMVVKARPELRKTTQATLAARVLHQGGRQVAGLRTRLAQGRHPHDTEWEPPAREYHKTITMSEEPEGDTLSTDPETATSESASDKDEVVATRIALKSDDLGKDAPAIKFDDDLDDDLNIDSATDDSDDVDEYFGKSDDSTAEEASDDDDLDDVAEVDEEPEDADEAAVGDDSAAGRRGRGGYDPDADLRRSETRYRARQRTLLALAVLTVVAAIMGLTLGTIGWAATGVAAALLVGYLFFLRRSVANEQRIRARRAARLARNRRVEAARHDRPESDRRAEVPTRLRRPGAVVLEIDDEDPVFDHLPHYQLHRPSEQPADYRRVV